MTATSPGDAAADRGSPTSGASGVDDRSTSAPEHAVSIGEPTPTEPGLSVDAGAPETGDPEDPVTALRAEFASIAAIPVADRVARFEHANAVLADELAQLDEV